MNDGRRDSPGREAPGLEGVERATGTPLAFAGTSRRERWQRVVDSLVASPSIDADQLYQAQRHAERRRWLLSHLTFLSASDLIRLPPDRTDEHGDVARTLAPLRSDDLPLAVRIEGDWKYPALQVGADGEVHEALPAFVARARDQGYDAWETLHWLVTPIVDEPRDTELGKPLPGIDATSSIEAIVEAARAKRAPGKTPVVPATTTPLSMLEQGDTGAFDRAVRRWLG